MRIAHLIAHAKSVPHYVPSLFRWLLCAPATRESYYQRKPHCEVTVTLKWWGKGTEQMRLGKDKYKCSRQNF